MKNYIFGLVALAGALSFSSCKKDANVSESFGNRSTSAADYAASSLPVVAVSGDITTAAHWTAGNVYEISGVVTVRSGGSLQIDPGTYIKSSVNTPGSPNGVLVIAKDGTINAVGEECNPIVFTSRDLLDGDPSTVGNPGEFGGVIILGNAPINTGSSNIEGLNPDDVRYSYGGNNEADSRGFFQNVRIEYAGFQLATNIEVNGLTLGGVGTGTIIDHVEVAWGLDDGFEFFGGTVNVSDLVSFSNDDDQFDMDLGYVGTVSNSIAIVNKISTHSASGGNSDSNGAEIDNNPSSFGATPVTHPTFDNVRIIGTANTTGITSPGFKNGITLRRGGELSFFNSIVTGFNDGLEVEATATAANTLVGSSSLHGFSNPIIGGISDLGGNTTSTANPAPAFGIPQPFFNEAGFNPALSYCWAKFDY